MTCSRPHGADVFTLSCDDCGRVVSLRFPTAIEGLSEAGSKGWGLTRSHDRCPACAKKAAKATARGAGATRTRRRAASSKS